MRKERQHRMRTRRKPWRNAARNLSPFVAMLAFASVFASSVPVKPRTCYEATFRIRVAKGLTVEDAPQLVEMMPICASRSGFLGIGFSSVQWRFADDAGKIIPRPYEGASPQIIFSREWRTCSYRFWTPENAARFDIFPHPGRKGDKVEFADLDVHEVPSPGTLNFNGDFSAAVDIPWGWQLVGTALLQKMPAGRPVVNVVEDTARSDLFPVRPGTRVVVKGRGSSPVLPDRRATQKATNVRIAFFSSFEEASTNRTAGDVAVSMTGENAVATRSVPIPEGKCWARLSVWNGILENIEVTEVAK